MSKLLDGQDVQRLKLSGVYTLMSFHKVPNCTIWDQK